MKLIHTADLHIGQILYQNYERGDEHAHFFAQLEKYCLAEKPDALIVSGDVFDVSLPSAAVKKAFNEQFVRLHELCPEMCIVVIAGNHDSPSRLEADSDLWALAGARVVGAPPSFASVPADGETPDWRERFIIRLESGYIVALPYMSATRTEPVQSILDKIAAENTAGKPVVLAAHLALTGADTTGHDEIGGMRTVPATELGSGYDYLALGHIHRPQTLGEKPDAPGESVALPAPVMRYSGSALHVSCDETFPHGVSLVEIDRHGGNVRVEPLCIEPLRRFYVLPEDGSAFADAESAIAAVKQFAEEKKRGYFRLRMNHDAAIPADFSQKIYAAIEPFGGEVRYNPKHLRTDVPATESAAAAGTRPEFAVADLQQMTDPLEFIEKTIGDYSELDINEVRELFNEVRTEVARLNEEAAAKSKTPKNSAGGNAENPANA